MPPNIDHTSECNTKSHDSYISPLTARYSSKEMCYNFSESKKFITWRKLWYYLASAQKVLGVEITDEQLKEMKENIENIDFEAALIEETKTKHDVMAHLKIYANCCPSAASIIHLGATSCFLTDNADLIIIRDAFDILIPKLLRCIKTLATFCDKYKELPTLGYTHFQPAQLTTVGKRALSWLSDLVIDFQSFKRIRNELRLRGCKGTVGTQASFLSLFDNDFSKVLELEQNLLKMAKFDQVYDVTGQTYSRKIDVDTISVLSSFGCTIHKLCSDIRLLSGLQELSEPFKTESQVGSSAMPYKRNPIRCERCCGLSRHLSSLQVSIMNTYSVQWLERTLDDSSNRRIVLPEAFLIADILLETVYFIFEGLTPFPATIRRNIKAELPFLAVESILIAMVKNGANRQTCHEKLRVFSNQTQAKIKEGESSDCFIGYIQNDEYFKPILPVLTNLTDPSQYIGCANLQVDHYLKNVVNPILIQNADNIAKEIPMVHI